MGVIDDVRLDRQDLAQVIEKYAGIRRTVEDLYPDKAHFIYELLQNAEDTGATKTSFTLDENKLRFEHNGKRPFTKKDLQAITNIGEGTKEDDSEMIGRFGIGFKSVFAYTENPHIWSPDLSFKIEQFVLPFEIKCPCEIVSRGITRFDFPFNSPKKDPDTAYEEILEGLTSISECTLLFLQNIRSLTWKQARGRRGSIQRISHDERHIEIQREIDEETIDTSHFLRASAPAKGVDGQFVAVAFELEELPKAKSKAPSEVAKGYRIVEAEHGTVSVFFPAEKEFSNLRFHIHGPFVPELSRASIKDTEVNDPLFVQVAELAANAMHDIKSIGLLTTNFLGVLPDDWDEIPDRYEVIREYIQEAFNTNKLTPTHTKTHAEAQRLVAGPATFKGILDRADLRALLCDDDILGWVAAAPPDNNNADCFLKSLSLQYLTIDKLIDRVYRDLDDDEALQSWIMSKDVEWFRRLYLGLDRILKSPNESRSDELIDKLKESRIVRRADGSMSIGAEAYFPSKSNPDKKRLLFVDGSLIGDAMKKGADGSSDDVKIYEFLQRIGVKKIGQEDQLKLFLDDYYDVNSDDPEWELHLKHMKIMIDAFEIDSGIANLAQDYYLVFCDDNLWRKPSGVYLDHPFVNTGLSAYYGNLGEDVASAIPSGKYLNEGSGIPKDAFCRFLIACGAAIQLEISSASCYENPNKGALKIYDGKLSHLAEDRDWIIEDIADVLECPTLELASLIWQTLVRNSHMDWHKAAFRNNARQLIRYATSQLAMHLCNADWIPQGDGEFVTPSEARRDLLPSNFEFDASWPWLRELHFGEDLPEKDREIADLNAKAKELGLKGVESLEVLQLIDSLDKEEKQEILSIIQEKRNRRLSSGGQIDRSFLPEDIPRNPEYRSLRVQEYAQKAPPPEKEVVNRTIDAAHASVRADARSYLLSQYTNDDGQTICQICHDVLPFKINGEYYFESVKAARTLHNHHEMNHLCLCPNHAAMFKHANNSMIQMRSLIKDAVGNRIPLILADREFELYFTTKHISDLRDVIQVEESAISRNEENPAS